MQFTATIIKGSGRGKRIGTPTINLNLEHVPLELDHGIYVVKIQIPNSKYQIPSVLHYGPRPVFKDTSSCEVHLLNTELKETPDSLTVEIIEKLRDVRDFPSVEALKKQIQNDIAQAHAILKTC